MKEVADAGERIDGLGRNAIEVRGGIAEAFRHGASHLEMKFAMRGFGDLRVHILDLRLECGAIDFGNRHDILLRSASAPCIRVVALSRAECGSLILSAASMPDAAVSEATIHSAPERPSRSALTPATSAPMA